MLKNILLLDFDIRGQIKTSSIYLKQSHLATYVLFQTFQYCMNQGKLILPYLWNTVRLFRQFFFDSFNQRKFLHFLEQPKVVSYNLVQKNSNVLENHPKIIVDRNYQSLKKSWNPDEYHVEPFAIDFVPNRASNNMFSTS